MAGQGRPTDYCQEIADKICERVATHTCGIRKLCAMYDDMPAVSSINLWRFKNPSFSAQYLEAKQAQMDLVMESLDDEMDENLHYYTDSEGNKRIDSPSATIAVAKANNRKWFASKIAPKLYGAKPEEKEANASESLLEKILSGEITINKK